MICISCKEVKTTSMIYLDVSYSGSRRNHSSGRKDNIKSSSHRVPSTPTTQSFSECYFLKKNTRTVESEFADFEGIDVGVRCCKNTCEENNV